MNNFIKLTNDADAHKGNTIYINADHITAIYEAPSNDGGFKTYLYGGPGGTTWEVEQSPKHVLDLITPVEYIK